MLSDSVGGAGTLVLDLKTKVPGSGSTAVAGSWRVTFTASGAQYQDTAEGVMSPAGATSASPITAKCSFAPPVLNVTPIIPFVVSVNDRRMTGTYVFAGCSGFGSGTIDVTRP